MTKQASTLRTKLYAAQKEGRDMAVRLGQAMETVQEQQLKLDGLSQKANLLAQQLDETERALLESQQDGAVWRERCNEKASQIMQLETREETLARVLVKAEFVPPRLQAITDGRPASAGISDADLRRCAVEGCGSPNVLGGCRREHLCAGCASLAPMLRAR